MNAAGETALRTTIAICVNVTNDGLSGATGVLVRVLLPEGYSKVTDVPAALGDCYAPTTRILDIGTIAVRETVTWLITVTRNATGELTNAAEIVTAD
ncbi:hypothetical protein ACSBLW_11455 [Thioclava sp. FR2]|uniref:hypothetical protein n=1 Tax=Thioclava sp. FR2 TaxID=3445780 RepID=UPI003EBE022F